MTELGKVCQHDSLERQCLICELEKQNTHCRSIALRLIEALRKIKAYGRPLEAPRASDALCAINDIAKEALASFDETRLK